MAFCVAVIVLVCALGINASYEHEKKGPRCYDCNYAPSGYVLSKTGYTGGHVGYLSCALGSESDRNSVDKWGCTSGMCFIRRDYNGLVYRGCANTENLPWAVNPQAQCQYQGDNQALWWFCEGDLCNEGQLGSSPDMCGSATPMLQQAYPDIAPVQNSYEPAPGNTNGGYGGNADGGYGGNADGGFGGNADGGNGGNADGGYGGNADGGYGGNADGGYGGNADGGYGGNDFVQAPSYGKSGKSDSGYGFNEVQDYEYPTPEAGTYLQISFDMDEVADTSYAYAASMCSGDCSHNPTGLWSFPGDNTKFIQCEAEHRANSVCTCCKPTAINCPAGTLYDDAVKVCVGTDRHLNGGLDGYAGYH